MTSFLTRRTFLLRATALGCSAAASPLVTPVSFAAAPWDNRLVVIILRGAMDGLDALRPVGDPAFARLRPDVLPGTRRAGAGLSDFYDLHPDLSPLLPLWHAGQLGFVNATSTPYRDKRSHFDGQDILEAGTLSAGEASDGWLNRMLQMIPGMTGETAYAIGRTEMLLAAGEASFSRWSPDARLSMSPATQHLLEGLTREDPLFQAAFGSALSLSGIAGESSGMTGENMMEPPRTGGGASGGDYVAIAAFAAQKLREAARIATFSINGWDTHANQEHTLRQPMRDLAQVIMTLHQKLGADWNSTAVIAMTEFGRTAQINGNGGTDHGTAGTMLFAGGALRGGQVTGRWPGLEEADLYARRDLMPTSDVRSHAAAIMQGIFGLDRGLLQEKIFPGLEMVAPGTGHSLVL